MRKNFKETIILPEGVTIAQDTHTFTVKGKKGQVQRTLVHPNIKINISSNTITLTSTHATLREKKLFYTFRAHLNNMIKGCSNGVMYKLRICSSHFPMNVAVTGNKITVKNFIGEKNPRNLTIKEGVIVKVDGSMVTVESADIELAGLTAGAIERLTMIQNKDLRKFQDGIYIIEKNGEPII